MNLRSLLVSILMGAWLLAGCGFDLSGCDYDSPITAKATDPVDTRLLGDWIGVDGKNPLQICGWDESTYAVAMNLQNPALYQTELAFVRKP